METAAQAEIRTELDPVTFEVLKNAFVNIVDQMGEVVVKTCYSFVIYARDFSSSITDSTRHGRAGNAGYCRTCRHLTLHGQGLHRGHRQGEHPSG